MFDRKTTQIRNNVLFRDILNLVFLKKTRIIVIFKYLMFIEDPFFYFLFCKKIWKNNTILIPDFYLLCFQLYLKYSLLKSTYNV